MQWIYLRICHGQSIVRDQEKWLTTTSVNTALLQQLQLLADCIPLAVLAGRTSRRPSNDGARHANKGEIVGQICQFRRGWGCEM